MTAASTSFTVAIGAHVEYTAPALLVLVVAGLLLLAMRMWKRSCRTRSVVSSPGAGGDVQGVPAVWPIIDVVTLPSRPAVPVRPPAQTLNEDDVIDFGLELEATDDVVAALLEEFLSSLKGWESELN